MVTYTPTNRVVLLLILIISHQFFGRDVDYTEINKTGAFDGSKHKENGEEQCKPFKQKKNLSIILSPRKSPMKMVGYIMNTTLRAWLPGRLNSKMDHLANGYCFPVVMAMSALLMKINPISSSRITNGLTPMLATMG